MKSPLARKMCPALFICVEDVPIQRLPRFNLLVEQNKFVNILIFYLTFIFTLEYLFYKWRYPAYIDNTAVLITREFSESSNKAVLFLFKTIPSSSSSHGAPTVSVLGTFPLPINYRTPKSSILPCPRNSRKFAANFLLKKNYGPRAEKSWTNEIIVQRSQLNLAIQIPPHSILFKYK
jgi:hypothetical protein